MSYIVMEIQTDQNGGVAIVPPSSFNDRNTAEQKYHTILAAAAVSNVPVHAAVMMVNDGRIVMSQFYEHPVPEEEA